MKKLKTCEHDKLRSNIFFQGMGRMKSIRRGVAFMSVLALLGVTFFAGCGGGLSSSKVPGDGNPSLSVEIRGSTGTDGLGNPSVRANGRDTFEVSAKASGLSSSIGFFLAANWGAFSGGTKGGDGFTYINADRNGLARATFVTSTNPGRAEVWVRSGTEEVRQEVTFDFAVMSIFPGTVELLGIAGNQVMLTARGALPPVTWDVSHPNMLEIIPINDISVYIRVKSNSALEDAGETVTVTALDAENTATATLTLVGGFDSASCDDATMTVSPSAPAASTGETISVVVVDADKAGDASVPVVVSGVDNTTITLTEWGSPGIFQITYDPPDTAGKYAFSYSDVGTGCVEQIVTVGITAT